MKLSLILITTNLEYAGPLFRFNYQNGKKES